MIKAAIQSQRMFSNFDKLFSVFDPKQLEYLNADKCIQISEKDEIINSVSKRDCHLIENINLGMLHRAFSLFLFDSNSKLLLQQRSKVKITYPLHFTNTCCSHPLFLESEIDGVSGVKNAVVRKLKHELGLSINTAQIEFVKRIIYRAENFVPKHLKNEISGSDGDKYCVFGENELDYVMVSQFERISEEIEIDLNANEVQEIRWVSLDELQTLMDDPDYIFTPWFRLIHNIGLLETIWTNIGNVESIRSDGIDDLTYAKSS